LNDPWVTQGKTILGGDKWWVVTRPGYERW
jgi:hypothetical protein